MTRLSQTHPALYQHFEMGYFSVQMSDHNTFGKIPVDQAIEEIVNKDTQTPGGTKGFSLKPSAVSKYYLTAEYRSTAMGKLRDLVDRQVPRLRHPDLDSSRILKDELDVTSVEDVLQDSWNNPFHEEPSDLMSISTGMVPSPDIIEDLLKAQE